MEKLTIRETSITDAPKVLEFIKRIAEYENMSADVLNTVEMIEQEVYIKKLANVMFIDYNGEDVGFALYFYNYSTFTGKKGLYIEDIFIDQEYRKLGFGKLVFNKLTETAKQNNCGRIEWTCLKWNTPSIEFYTKLGATPMTEWDTWRINL